MQTPLSVTSSLSADPNPDAQILEFPQIGAIVVLAVLISIIITITFYKKKAWHL
jgi:hypothetical protein